MCIKQQFLLEPAQNYCFLTGSHWINALVSTLLKYNDLENTPTGHLPNIDMLPTDSIESRSPPRVISTHLTYKYLPIQHRQRQAKIILMLRNPKDVAVSFYHFATKEANIFYDGSLENFITLFLKGKGKTVLKTLLC